MEKKKKRGEIAIGEVSPLPNSISLRSDYIDGFLCGPYAWEASDFQLVCKKRPSKWWPFLFRNL